SPKSTLFPYTTLFRSIRQTQRDRIGRCEIFFHAGSLGRIAENEGGGESWRRRQQKIYHLRSRTSWNGGRSGARRSGKSCRRDVRSEEHTSELQSLAYL